METELEESFEYPENYEEIVSGEMAKFEEKYEQLLKKVFSGEDRLDQGNEVDNHSNCGDDNTLGQYECLEESFDDECEGAENIIGVKIEDNQEMKNSSELNHDEKLRILEETCELDSSSNQLPSIFDVEKIKKMVSNIKPIKDQQNLTDEELIKYFKKFNDISN